MSTPTLRLRFPGRRYHATPWGRHVNEGAIEWPPSPWRLLRALLATGYATLGWPGSEAPPEARALIAALASVLPRYRLPPAAGAHSRHYMPLGVLDKGREKTTLVFDTWAQIDGGELLVRWDVDLPPEQTALLAQLAGHLNYLGRSESWVEARLSGPDEGPPEFDCTPVAGRLIPGPGWEQVSLLAPASAEEYSLWREEAVATALAALPPLPPGPKPGKKPTKAYTVAQARRDEVAGQFPIDLHAALQITTHLLQQQGWSLPPGSRQVVYLRPADALEAGAPRARRAHAAAAPVEAMLLSLTTASRNDHALPPVTRTLPQGERLHRALVALADRRFGTVLPVLSGCDAAGRPLASGHQHAHVLPLDLDGDGHLEHFLIWAPQQLEATAQAVVRALRQTYAKGGLGELQLALTAAGSLADLRGLALPWSQGVERLLGPTAGATRWITATPFVPPRFLKPRGRNSLAGQVAAELAARGLPEACEVQPLDPGDPRWSRLRHFVRTRQGGPQPPVDCGFPLLLHFERPVVGPLCLGYGSHLGLGRFCALSDDEQVVPVVPEPGAPT